MGAKKKDTHLHQLAGEEQASIKFYFYLDKVNYGTIFTKKKSERKLQYTPRGLGCLMDKWIIGYPDILGSMILKV